MSEADLIEKIGIYADKLNERIACDEVSIVDDGTINVPQALSVDDEGEPTGHYPGRKWYSQRLYARFYQCKSYGVKPSEADADSHFAPATATDAMYLYDAGRTRA